MSLNALARRQAAEVRETRWHDNINALVQILGDFPPQMTLNSAGATAHLRRRRRIPRVIPQRPPSRRPDTAEFCFASPSRRLIFLTLPVLAAVVLVFVTVWLLGSRGTGENEGAQQTTNTSAISPATTVEATNVPETEREESQPRKKEVNNNPPTQNRLPITLTGSVSGHLAVTILNNAEFFSLRDVASTFDFAYRDDKTDGTVTLRLGERNIIFSPDYPMLSVSGRAVSLSRSPVRVNDRWFVPLDFVTRGVALALDEKIDLDEPDRTLVVQSIQ